MIMISIIIVIIGGARAPTRDEAQRALTIASIIIRILIPVHSLHCRAGHILATFRHRPNGHLAQQVPGLFLASRFTMCLNCEVLKGMFPWRTRYPLS